MGLGVAWPIPETWDCSDRKIQAVSQPQIWLTFWKPESPKFIPLFFSYFLFTGFTLYLTATTIQWWINHYFCNLIAYFPCPSLEMSYELLMLLGRKIFSTTMIFLTWWWFPSQNKQGKKLCYQYHRKWMEKKVENTSCICMLKTRFKPMGRGILPFLARVNNFMYKHLEQDISLGWKPWPGSEHWHCTVFECLF